MYIDQNTTKCPQFSYTPQRNHFVNDKWKEYYDVIKEGMEGKLVDLDQIHPN